MQGCGLLGGCRAPFQLGGVASCHVSTWGGGVGWQTPSLLFNAVDLLSGKRGLALLSPGCASCVRVALAVQGCPRAELCFQMWAVLPWGSSCSPVVGVLPCCVPPTEAVLQDLALPELCWH